METAMRAEQRYDLAASDLGESPSDSLNGLAGVESRAQEPLRIQTDRIWSLS